MAKKITRLKKTKQRATNLLKLDAIFLRGRPGTMNDLSAETLASFHLRLTA